MGTKATSAVVGSRDVDVSLNVSGSGVLCTFRDVLHVPDFEYSLLSVRKMSWIGLPVSFERGRCVIRSRGAAVATTSLMGSSYVLEMYDKSASAHVAALYI